MAIRGGKRRALSGRALCGALAVAIAMLGVVGCTVASTEGGGLRPAVVAPDDGPGRGTGDRGGAPVGERALVTRVVDGDTIEVELEDGRIERVRYIGVDTPERGRPYYREATAFNRNLVLGKTVTLVRDVSERDRYGRLLRYVYAGEVFVNAELVRSGYAVPLTIPPDVSFADEFVRLSREARAAGRGLWQDR